MGFGRPIRDYVEALLHARARTDSLTAARHRAFITTRLLTSFAGLAAFPLYVAARGVPGGFEVLVFGCLAMPMLVAFDLSRTGEFDRAQVLSALALAALGSGMAAASGGITPLAALWLALAPLEAALSASRRIMAFAVAVACGAAALLVFLEMQNLFPAAPAPRELAALGAVAAAVYIGGTAFAAQSLTRGSAELLRAEQERYRLVTASMAEAMTRHAPNGAVLYASPAAESLVGVEASALLGQGLYDRVHEADRRAYVLALADAASGRPATAELRVRRGAIERGQPQQLVPVEMRCQPFDAASPGTNGREVIALTRDVSDRKAQQRTVEDVGADLARAGEANAKLLATLSHELRTPLNAIVGFSQIMANELHMPRDDARWRSYAQLINESGTHMMSVVDAMLDASGIEGGELHIAPEAFHPAPVIKSCCDLLAVEARRAGLDLALRVEGALPTITADLRAFRQILINLLTNAVKYTDRGGRIVVGARTEASALLFSVEDTGIGVASEDLPRLADPFFQTRAGYARRRSGSGLGLSIVKGLVALHGGELDIASRIGEGTRVTVRLPLAGQKFPPAEINRTSASRRAIPPAVGAADIRVKKSA